MQSGIFSGLYNVVLSKLNKRKQNKINNIDSLKLLTRNLKYFIIRKEYGFNKNVQKRGRREAKVSLKDFVQ